MNGKKYPQTEDVMGMGTYKIIPIVWNTDFINFIEPEAVIEPVEHSPYP